MAWGSRSVLAWRVSPTLAGACCLEALAEALAHGPPAIFPSEQGSPLTSQECPSRLTHAEGRLRRDRLGRGDDHRFVARLGRTVKGEEVEVQDDVAGPEGIAGIGDYGQCAHPERPHQA